MPLARFEVRNEYRLGQSDLYKEASRREDPKAVVDGVAVAGLVGILRQLGDLAEFAAEVFHGLQERVTVTASRSRKLTVRVQIIEAALPSLEKAVLAQTSHIHFAYTPGSEWHCRIQNRQNHFIYNDLPRFIMDSYEECRDPPRLHLLDKFDTGGPGSCLKRYSDPTFFRRASGNFKEQDAETIPKKKKTRKIKKKRSSRRNMDLLRSASMPNQRERMSFTTPTVNGHRSSPSHTASITDMTLNSDLGYYSNSFDSRTGSTYVEHVFQSSSSAQPEVQESEEVSLQCMHHNDVADSVVPDGYPRVVTDVTFDSDLDDRSNSFDSRTGSTYVERVFHLSSSAQTEEEESKEVPSRCTHHNDVCDSVILDGYPSIATDNCHQICSPEQIRPRLSSDNCDKKPEAMEPEGVKVDESDGQLMSTTDSDLCVQNGLIMDLKVHNGVIMDLKIPDQMDVAFVDDNMLRSGNDRIDVDEAESEPDNYVDALNIIESESENDLECQNEMEQFSSHVENERTKNEANNVAEHISDVPSKNGSHIASDLSSNASVALDLHNNVRSNSFSREHTSSSSGDNSDAEKSLPGCESFSGGDAIYGPKVQSIVSGADTLSSGCAMPSKIEPSSDESPRPSCKSQEPRTELDTVQPVSLWINGDAIDGLKIQSVISVSDPLSSGGGMPSKVEPSSDELVIPSCKSQDPQAEFATVQPVSFWTNGGLLGLEPSKPPDFAVANASSKDSKPSGSDSIGPPVHISMLINDGEGGRSGRSFKDDRSMERVALGSQCSTLDSQVKDQGVEVEKTVRSHQSNRSTHAYDDGHKINNVVKSGKELPLGVNVKASSCIQENEENLSQMCGLGQRLLINGFCRKMSLVPDGEYEQLSPLKSSASYQRNGHLPFTNYAPPDKTFDEKFGHKSPLGSPTSSPPLEHMKISFHPVDGLEASQINLKFPDGNHINGSIRDVFPAFQLVPQPAVPLNDACSDSDDDTFCRSSPYMSDDGPSYHTDSDSELWESDESPKEPCDSLCRISSVKSVSSPIQPAGPDNNGLHINSGLDSVYVENGMDSSLSPSVLDLPSFDAVNPVIPGESEDKLEPRNFIELQYPKNRNPSPPPPPPVQCWATKITSYVEEDKHNAISKAHDHGVDLKLSESTESQQHKPLPAEDKQTDEATAFQPMSEQQAQWKLSVQKEANLTGSAQPMDDKDDLLHQIRTKSFTLKRAAMTKPAVTSGPIVNDKVTAILEKAIAIRQAVGSDNGEDDDAWSDT